MKRREKILQTALILYNEHGIDNVSSRQIAEKMGISDGNLRYHFPKQDQLVFALYEDLVAKIDIQLAAFMGKDLSFQNLFASQIATMEVFLSYKFIFQDFAGVMRRFEPIRIHFIQLMEGRAVFFAQVVELMKNRGLFRKKLPAKAYSEFAFNMGIINNFWINDATIFHAEVTSEVLHKYAVRIFYGMVPLLSQKGLKLLQAEGF